MKVSILIPAIRPTFLKQAIESALSQTISAEVIVSDDTTDDQIIDVVNLFKDKVIYVRHGRYSPNENHDFAVAHASGEFIKFLHDDDLFWSDRALENFIDAFENHESSALVICHQVEIDVRGEETEQQRFLELRAGHVPRDYILKDMHSRVGGPSAVMFRKEHYGHYGNYDFNNFVSVGGMATWLDITRNGKVWVLGEPLIAVREHPDRFQYKLLRRHRVEEWDRLKASFAQVK